jgi:hypothetical protein
MQMHFVERLQPDACVGAHRQPWRSGRNDDEPARTQLTLRPVQKRLPGRLARLRRRRHRMLLRFVFLDQRDVAAASFGETSRQCSRQTAVGGRRQTCQQNGGRRPRAGHAHRRNPCGAAMLQPMPEAQAPMFDSPWQNIFSTTPVAAVTAVAVWRQRP